VNGRKRDRRVSFDIPIPKEAEEEEDEQEEEEKEKEKERRSSGGGEKYTSITTRELDHDHFIRRGVKQSNMRSCQMERQMGLEWKSEGEKEERGGKEKKKRRRWWRNQRRVPQASERS